MKIFEKDFGKGRLNFKVDNLDDLWYLSHIITEGDHISGKSMRKIKVNEKKMVRKTFFFKIRVEKVEFHKYMDSLRVSGIVEEGAEEVTTGSYHTFNVNEGSEFRLEKNKFHSYQKDKVREATEERQPKIMLVALDREHAYLAFMKRYGYETLAHITGDVQKKGYEQAGSDFYGDLKKAIADYDSRYGFEKIVVCSPAFFKEDFLKRVQDENLKKKIVEGTCSAVNDTVFDEILKREEIKAVLEQDKISAEIAKVEKLMEAISKDSKYAYGFEETNKAASMGAVSELLVSDNLIFDYREKEKFNELDEIMTTVDSSRGEVNIISSDHEGGKKLDGLGGIAALLRFRME